jgi:signal transduction histidine kinase
MLWGLTPDPQLDLTPQEVQWLQEHPVIKVGFDPSWAPLEYVDKKGQIQGISGDYLRVIEKKLGIRFDFTVTSSWNETLENAKNRKTDITSMVIKTPERSHYFNYTEPYFFDPMMIYTQDDVSFISSLKELQGKRVCVVDGYVVEEMLKRDFPEIEVITSNNIEDGLCKLSRGEVFAFIDDHIATTYYIRKNRHYHLKIAGQAPYEYSLRMGIRKDWGMLVGILQKALDAIPENQRNDIYRKWVPLIYEPVFDYILLWKILIPVGISVCVVFVYWNQRLRREIHIRRKVEDKLHQYQEHLEDLVAERTETLMLEIKEREKVEQQKEKLLYLLDAKNKELESILSVSCHDLRSPLVNIAGFSEMLQNAVLEIIRMLKGLDIPGQYRERLEVMSNELPQSTELIVSNVQKMNVLLGGVMNVIQVGQQKVCIEEVDVNRTIQKVLEPLSDNIRQEQIRIHVENLPNCQADAELLSVVFEHLLKNAIQYRKRDQSLEIEITGKVENNQCIYCVRDNGIGIDPAYYDNIFEIFHQLSPRESRGIGLGLTMVRRIMDLHNGTIWVESQPGKGSCFFISLPKRYF